MCVAHIQFEKNKPFSETKIYYSKQSCIFVENALTWLIMKQHWLYDHSVVIIICCLFWCSQSFCWCSHHLIFNQLFNAHWKRAFWFCVLFFNSLRFVVLRPMPSHASSTSIALLTLDRKWSTCHQCVKCLILICVY